MPDNGEKKPSSFVVGNLWKSHICKLTQDTPIQRRSTWSPALPLMNIPRTKNSQQQELETPNGQDLDGFGGFFMTLKASRQSETTLHDFVTSKRHLRGC